MKQQTEEIPLEQLEGYLNARADEIYGVKLWKHLTPKQLNVLRISVIADRDGSNGLSTIIVSMIDEHLGDRWK